MTPVKEQISLIRKYPALLSDLHRDEILLTGGCNRNKKAISFKALYNNTPMVIKQRGVTTRPPKITTWKEKGDDSYTRLRFNFKGDPSTTGNRQKGYVKFLVPDAVVEKKGEKNVDVAVFCSCPYFTYNLEYVLTNTVSPSASEIKNSNGAAPKVLNLSYTPHLCKHLADMMDYLED